jgi:translation initiation factor 3 subunit H
MLRSLKEVQGDDSVIGFYIATPFSAFFTHHLLDMQVAHQERLRQGGIVLVHGKSATKKILQILM